MSPVPAVGRRTVAAGAAAAVVLGLATTGVLAATGAFRTSPAPHPGRYGGPAAAARCAVPALPGRTVDVVLTDMGPGMMQGPGPGPGPGVTPAPDGSAPWGPGPHGGRMRVLAAPQEVPAGTVSFRVVNAGMRLHELVVLPLPAGGDAGRLPVGAGDRVDEAGSPGEASRSCGAGAGGGIVPGAAAWTTLTLRPGRYALVCNLPGHYRAGMHTELDVTAR
ncbi:hypothetical protein LO771_27060 [Streptacidiphilus sp. ASG 303]|uniref:hypothetical protein n=1 Tax=Streptacidiphilus sp. ASG 303 TaxID=2896847 RepID=UPI001E40BD2A|nr:hypothetical protein [Streptacidiphilus sp. ASG 303]MCD0485949.1 hypothetical protein [Streptacidiphilus sp. ASG 303]